MKTCILNFATGHYKVGQSRLMESLVKQGETDFMFYNDEGSPLDCPPHSENPYAFKTYAIHNAMTKGYTHILWLDASVYAVAPLKKLWKEIDTKGHLMLYAGHLASTWANDKCLDYFKMSRDEAEKVVMYGNAGVLGLNLENPRSMSFFENWHAASVGGIFKGAWNNSDQSESKDPRCCGHRHDMVVGSIIAYRLGMEYCPEQDWLQYCYSDVEEQQKTKACLYARGI